MGIFTTVKSDQFQGLSNSPTDILVANEHVIQVNSILVTSQSKNNIQVNLQRSITNGELTSVADINANRIVPSPYVRQAKEGTQSTELLPFVYFLGLNSEGSTDKLTCFSNGAAQIFNLQISYTILNETPFGGAC